MTNPDSLHFRVSTHIRGNDTNTLVVRNVLLQMMNPRCRWLQALAVKLPISYLESKHVKFYREPLVSKFNYYDVIGPHFWQLTLQETVPHTFFYSQPGYLQAIKGNNARHYPS